MGAPCFNEGVVAALLEGTLDGPRSSEAKRHMLECEPCRRLAEKAGVALGEEVETEAHPVATVPEESHERALTTKGDPGELPAGHTLGRYVVAKRIGRGGMGVVYLAFDNDLERRVALKVLRPEGTFGSDTGELRTRMLREAQAMAKVSHPNVVAVYDVGSFGEQIFVAMEYVRGGTLRAWSQTPRATKAILSLYRQAGRGLEAAHRAGILHRDFKPENVLVDDQGHVKVVDFGLARLDDREPRAPSRGHVSHVALDETGVNHRIGLGANLTSAGQVIGTPAYMAPEQLRGEKVDPRTDQFSFCVALYEALCGARPFGEGMEGLAKATTGTIVPLAAESKLPRGVRQALRRGLSADPDSRFASMTELLEAIERAMARPKLWLGVLALAAVGAAAAGVAIRMSAPGAQCRGGEAELAGVWDEPRRAAVRSAFEATRVPYADGAFREVERALDGYVATWVSMRRDACEATMVRGEQSGELMDLRMACLQERSVGLRA